MRIAILLFLIIFLVSACTSQDTADQLEIQDTVKAYTKLLFEGYRSLNMTPLTRIATPRRITRAYHHMAALGEGNVKMDAEIEQLLFLDSRVSDAGKAEVKTSERWVCQYYTIDSNQKVSENIIIYENIYHLIHKTGRWLVDDITIINYSEMNKNSGLPFFQRPADTPIGAPQPAPEKELQTK
jgi:hypothetical protein